MDFSSHPDPSLAIASPPTSQVKMLFNLPVVEFCFPLALALMKARMLQLHRINRLGGKADWRRRRHEVGDGEVRWLRQLQAQRPRQQRQQVQKV